MLEGDDSHVANVALFWWLPSATVTMRPNDATPRSANGGGAVCALPHGTMGTSGRGTVHRTPTCDLVGIRLVVHRVPSMTEFIRREVTERYSDSSVKKKPSCAPRIALVFQAQRHSSAYGEDTRGGMTREAPRDGINSVS